MKELDFKPAKSKTEFHQNYRLHDYAENICKSLLTQWGIQFKKFGDDKRYEKLWEKGEDKPDLIINYEGKSALLDWKGKRKPNWIVNKRAIDSYRKWQDKLNCPVIIAFFLFDSQNNLNDRRFAFLPVHSYNLSEQRQWDKNKTVEFSKDLPKFTKDLLIKYLDILTNDKQDDV